MKKPKKPHLVYAEPTAPQPVETVEVSQAELVKYMSAFVASLKPDSVQARIAKNLERIQKLAEQLLREKGIARPRYTTLGEGNEQLAKLFQSKGSSVVSASQVDEQAKLATDAHTSASMALDHLRKGDHLNTADCALIASSKLEQAIPCHPLPQPPRAACGRRKRPCESPLL